MKPARNSLRRRAGKRASFTLVELMIVSMIIAILASSTLFALYGVQEDAREARTRAQITRINEFIMEFWESYRTRALPVTIPRGLPIGPEAFTDANGNGIWDTGESYIDRNGNNSYDWDCVAYRRLTALHELMRMELPDRITDLEDNPNPLATPSYLNTAPPLWRTYRRRAGFTSGAAPASWSQENQGAECLYLILSQIRHDDSSALDYFTPSEIGDVDQDGMPEILDAWGKPIEFLRWPAGYATLPGDDGGWGVAGQDDDGNGTVDDVVEAGWTGSDDRTEIMARIPAAAPDPFNPFGAAPAGFAMYPLIFSAGRDKLHDIFTDVGTSPAIRYATTAPPNNPYYIDSGSGFQLGKTLDANGNGTLDFTDNITNHSLIGASL